MAWNLLRLLKFLTILQSALSLLYAELPREIKNQSSGFLRAPPNDEQRLLRHIMRTYDKSVRPVWSAKMVVSVAIGLTLTHIFNVDEKKQVLSMNVWLEQEWMDERISWSPILYGNITQLTVPTRFIWTPDIVLYNNAEDFSNGIAQTNVAVYSSGMILWAPPVKFHSTCKLDVSFFPFDDQICFLRFGSWIYDEKQVDVTNRSGQITLDKDSYIENGEWQVVATHVQRYIHFRQGVSERNASSFPNLTFILHLRRRTLYYLYNIIIPCIMLSILTMMQFWLPCESGEKVTLGLTVLLAYSVFSFNIAENMPETSEVIPLIAIYLMSIMGISAISVTLSVIVLNMRHGGERCRAVPGWLHQLTYKVLGNIIFWHSDLKFPVVQQQKSAQITFQQAFSQLSEQLANKKAGTHHGETYSLTLNAPVLGEKTAPVVHTFVKKGCKTGANFTGGGQVAPNATVRTMNIDKGGSSLSTTDTLSAPMTTRMRRARQRDEVRHEIMDRAGRLMDKMEKEKKSEELRDEWRRVSRIFDQFFFALITIITTLVTVAMLMVAPRFSKRDLFQERGLFEKK